MRAIDPPRVRRALAALDRLLAAYPELRGEDARVATFIDTMAELHEHEADLTPLAAIPAANDR